MSANDDNNNSAGGKPAADSNIGKGKPEPPVLTEKAEPRVVTPAVSAAEKAADASEADAKSSGKDKTKGKTKDKAKPVRNPRPGMTRFEAFLLLLTLLIALAAAAAVAWMYQQQYLKPAEPDPQLQALRVDLNQQEKALRSLSASLEEQQNKQLANLSQMRSELQQSTASLSRQQQTLVEAVTALSTVDRSDWLLAEAEYLLRLANQRAQLNRDAASAAKLLGSADAILRGLDDPALHTVRAALADEIAALKGTADFDVEGTYLKLAGLVSLCADLTLFEAPKYTPEAQTEAAEQWQDRLRSGLAYAWNKLRSYIRVRHHDANFQAVLAPEQEAVLRASLRLMLEQAQLALLAERPALYQRSLEKAREALRRYYLLDDRREAAIGEIDALIRVPVAQDIADISGSLRELKLYVDSRRWQREAAR